MKIGIDCRTILNTQFGELAGVGHYTYYLLKYLLDMDKVNEYVLFFYDHRIKVPEFEQPNVKIVYFPGLENIGKIPFFYRHWFIPQILRLYRLDLYHNPANIIPIFHFKKSLITVHDLAVYKHPEWFPGRQFFNLRILMPWSFSKARKIIAVSQSTKDDLIKLFGVKKEKIEVIYEGVEDYTKISIDESKLSEKVKLADQFFLFIGSLEPRKNLARLVEAFAEFIKTAPDKNIKLILAGKKGWKYEPIFEAIDRFGLHDKVIYLGYITLEEKVYLLKKAIALTYPSLYEGFGLPIIEAMNLGVPIITSNVASIPELVIDNALLIDPYDVQAIKEAMQKIVGDKELRKSLAKKSQGIAQNFTWQECAKKTLAVYESLK
ncbi:MAG: glycosyltransferase family 1 protein [Patescibacteria group bacterium]